MDLTLLNAGLNSICHLLALLGAHHILHVSKVRVKVRWGLRSSEMLRSADWYLVTEAALQTYQSQIQGSRSPGGSSSPAFRFLNNKHILYQGHKTAEKSSKFAFVLIPNKEATHKKERERQYYEKAESG